MLAGSGSIPSGDYSFEVKWDGFRALVRQDGRLLVRSRREILERIDFRGCAHVPEIFGDGTALFDAVCEQELEGVIAKRLNEPYRPGERVWIKTKNRAYWRYEIEREGG